MTTRRPPTDPPRPDDVPAPDAEPTAAEKTQARAFGDLLDKALAGRTPPAMSADDRELLDVATIIRAVAHPSELPAARTGSIVDGALRRAIGEAERPPGASAGDVVPLASRRASRVPWMIAASTTLVAAAAVVMLVVGVGRRAAAPETGAVAATTTRTPSHWRSRPADDTVGEIPRERSGDAGSRIDAIFADRLDGFRARTLAGRTARRGGRP